MNVGAGGQRLLTHGCPARLRTCPSGRDLSARQVWLCCQMGLFFFLTAHYLLEKRPQSAVFWGFLDAIIAGELVEFCSLKPWWCSRGLPCLQILTRELSKWRLNFSFPRHFGGLDFVNLFSLSPQPHMYVIHFY